MGPGASDAYYLPKDKSTAIKNDNNDVIGLIADAKLDSEPIALATISFDCGVVASSVDFLVHAPAL